MQQPALALGAESDVVGGGMDVHQLEMLMDHTNAQPVGVLRGMITTGRPSTKIEPLSGW